METSKSLILSSFGGFVANHVRVGAAQARRTDSLMRIDPDWKAFYERVAKDIADRQKKFYNY